MSVANVEPVAARVVKLGSRADGVTTAYPLMRMRRGEVLPFWVDVSKWLGSGFLAGVEDVASSDAEAVEVVPDTAGVCAAMVVILLSAPFADSHSESVISCTAVSQAGDRAAIEFTVERASDDSDD